MPKQPWPKLHDPQLRKLPCAILHLIVLPCGHVLSACQPRSPRCLDREAGGSESCGLQFVSLVVLPGSSSAVSAAVQAAADAGGAMQEST